jgi:ribosomal protein S18 acetylase RimI-like enzyme
LLTIRFATTDDAQLIHELALKVWPQTYADIISKEQIDFMMEMMYNETSLQKQMEEGCCFIISYDEEAPVGFAAYQEIQPTVYKLHKLYVLTSQQGKGTGRFLIDFIIRNIEQQGATAVQLQVNRNNQAIIFYEKLGFKKIQEADFDIGNGFFMNDYVMEKRFG